MMKSYPPIKCEHSNKNEVYNYFCYLCKKFVCHSCVCLKVAYKATHKPILIKDFATKFLKDIKDNITNIEGKISEYDNTISEELVKILESSKDNTQIETDKLIDFFTSYVTNELRKNEKFIEYISKNLRKFDEESQKNKEEDTEMLEKLNTIKENLEEAKYVIDNAKASVGDKNQSKKDILKEYDNFQKSAKDCMEFNKKIGRAHV